MPDNDFMRAMKKVCEGPFYPDQLSAHKRLMDEAEAIENDSVDKALARSRKRSRYLKWVNERWIDWGLKLMGEEALIDIDHGREESVGSALRCHVLRLLDERLKGDS